MPTYEYVCTSCGHRLEVVQSFSDPALTTCGVCHGRLRKVFGNVGIVLKGSGFYKTDSRGTSRSNGSGSAAKEKEPTTSKDSGSSKDSSSKDAPASTPSPSSSGGPGGSEKAAASNSR